MSATRTAFATPATCRYSDRYSYSKCFCLLLVAVSLLAPSRVSAAVSITLTPAVVNLPSSTMQQFTATVTGSSDTTVIWTVREGMPGGTITGSGLYTAPGVVGVYHIVATSHADSSQSATATIAVPGFTSSGLFMNVGRVSHTATQLQDGRILFIGGLDGAGLETSSAEIYDPGTGKFTLTGSLSAGRFGHSATLLPNGKILVAGGARYSSNPALVPTVELYDPQSGTFSPTGNLGELRFLHTATLLPDGKVFVAGGQDTVPGFSGQASIGSAELYDPVSGTFSFTTSMNAPRFWHTATLLNNGRVLIAGGTVNAPGSYPPLLPTPGEMYDPETGRFTNIGAFGNEMSEDASAAVPLQSGQVLVWATTIYDPVANTFSNIPNFLTAPSANRQGYTGTLLPNREVLITGGDGVISNQDMAAAFLLDPARASWTQVRGMSSPRVAHTANLLSNGLVLIAGGGTAFNQWGFASAELYQPPLAASAPSVTSISPNPITGFTPITFTVLGTNFVVGAIIRVDGTMLATTFSSDTQLSATILMGTLQAPGAHTVTVTNIDGESSVPFVLTIEDPIFQGDVANGSSVSLGNIPLGATSSTSLSFSNQGNVPLSLDSLTIAGANSGDFVFDLANTTCPLQGGAIQPQASCSVYIKFVPQVVGQRSAVLTATYVAPGTPFQVTLTGTGTNFVITPVTGNTGSATVAAGQPAIFQLSISPQVFTGAVSVNCLEMKPIPNTMCTVSPSPAMLNGTTATPVTVTVTTMARSGAAAPGQTKRFRHPGAYDPRIMRLLFYLLVLVVLTIISGKGRRRIRLALTTAFLFGLLATGCGGIASTGGGSNPPPSGSGGTPAGSYQLVVTAASSGVTRTTTLSLTVQ